MKAIKLLQDAATVLGAPGDINEQNRQNVNNDINLFLDDQKRRSADDQAGIRVSVDGENWEYADTVHVVSRIHQEDSAGMKEFSMIMTSGQMSMDVRSTINTESSVGTVNVDYEALTTFGIEGITQTESGANEEPQ